MLRAEIFHTVCGILPVRPAGRFSRQCVENLRVSELEGPEVVEVALPKAATEAAVEVFREQEDYTLAIFRRAPATLLKLDDPAPRSQYTADMIVFTVQADCRRPA